MHQSIAIILSVCFSTAAIAQSAQFTFEMRDADGEVLGVLSESDSGFAVGLFDPDLIEVTSDVWTIRWSGRFENAQSPENLGLIRNNTFIQFTHPTAGDISCRPAEDPDQPNSWTRNINRDALKAGFLNFTLSDCQDATGASIDVPALPLMVQGAYMLEK